MAERVSRLSLVSQYDDLCRQQAMFHDGLDSEFLRFIRNQEVCRVRWLKVERELKALQAEYETTQQEVEHLKANSENLRRKLVSERKLRSEAEQRLEELTRLFGEVKEVVNRDNTITDQTKERFAMWQKYEPMDPIQEDVLSDHSILYDKTEDDLDLLEGEFNSQARKRCSGNRAVTPPKRQKSSEEVFLASKDTTSFVATTTVHLVPERGGSILATSKIDTYNRPGPAEHMTTAQHHPPPVYTNQHKRRSRSEPEAFIMEPPQQFRPVLSSEPNPDNLYPSNMLASMAQQENLNFVSNNTSRASVTPINPKSNSMPFRQHNSASKLIGKAHDFACKTVIRPEPCLPCGRRIKFSKQALKCHNCRVTCHPECKANVPLPCVPPVTYTPTNKGVQLTITDFAPAQPPKVPAIIVHCVKEVEARGLSEVGLYRLSAPEKEVRDLKEKFSKGKGAPNMSRMDIHVVCALIKDFLRNLETLIPRTMWKEFTDAGVINDPEDSASALYQFISQLPKANQDTLAFLIMHWKRVAEAPEVKMPIKNLATVLAPTIVGFSSNSALEPAVMMKEQLLQVKVLEKLMNLPSLYWTQILDTDENTQLFPALLKPSDLITPEPRTASTLRPNASKHNAQSKGSASNATPRGLPTNLRRVPKKYFASPNLY